MYLRLKGRASTGFLVSVCALCITQAAFGAGAKSRNTSDKYEFPKDLFVTVSAHLIEGDLDREGSAFSKIPGVNGALIQGLDGKISASGGLTGMDGEASIGKWFGVRAYEVVVGGNTASSTAAWNGTATVLNDKQSIAYHNSYNRQEGYAGMRMTMLSSGSWASAKEAPKLQPMGFVSFGDVTVDETMSGASPANKGVTGNPWAYRNSIDLSYMGVGVGVSASGPLAEIARVRVGYFGSLRAAAELQQAAGSSQTECAPTRANKYQAVATKDLQSDQTAFSMLAEAGLSVALMTGVDIELGGRYRRMDAPQVGLTSQGGLAPQGAPGGNQEASIKFDSSTEMTGFLGLKAGF
jgi:hypothetical protein